MKSALIIAMCLAAGACSTPHVPDPQFIFPDVPAELLNPPQRLVPLVHLPLTKSNIKATR